MDIVSPNVKFSMIYRVTMKAHPCSGRFYLVSPVQTCAWQYSLYQRSYSWTSDSNHPILSNTTQCHHQGSRRCIPIKETRSSHVLSNEHIGMNTLFWLVRIVTIRGNVPVHYQWSSPSPTDARNNNRNTPAKSITRHAFVRNIIVPLQTSIESTAQTLSVYVQEEQRGYRFTKPRAFQMVLSGETTGKSVDVSAVRAYCYAWSAKA